MNIKLYVIAKRWSDEEKAVINYVAGEFNSYTNAELFKAAYDKHYSANAVIISEKNLLAGKLPLVLQ